MLSPELVAANAAHRWAEVPDPITLEWLQGQCSTLERVLRLQFDGGRLADEAERELADVGAPDDMASTLQRWALLKFLYRRWQDGDASRPAAAPDSGLQALEDLMLRTPITIQISGERVEVTGRSYTAMYEMAAHGLAAEVALEDAQRIEELARRAKSIRRRGHRRRRLRRLRGLHEVAYTTAQRHRRAFYAHAATADGAPAATEDEAPDWWKSITPAEHALLVGALVTAGAARGSELPPPPPSRDVEGRREPEGFGGLTLLTAWGLRTGVEPASMLHRDYGQVVAELRLQAEVDAVPEEARYL